MKTALILMAATLTALLAMAGCQADVGPRRGSAMSAPHESGKLPPQYLEDRRLRRLLSHGGDPPQAANRHAPAA